MSNELQNSEMYLPGNLGTISVGGKVSDIIIISKSPLATTITIKHHPANNPTEDADFEIIEQKLLKPSTNATSGRQN